MLRDLFSLFPAYAGVIPTIMDGVKRGNPFPRIRGGDPLMIQAEQTWDNFSPHTRG